MSGVHSGPLLPTPPPGPASTPPPNFNSSVGVGERCSRLLDYNYDATAAVICAMYLVFGIVYSLLGNALKNYGPNFD